VFEYVTVRPSDADASRRFYETVLAPLGLDGWREFRLAAAAQPPAATRGLHIAFVARSRDEVDAFWRAGVRAGYDSDGDPGPRPIYSPDYYGGFLLDPDGNSAEAAYLGREREGAGVIDHLWIRVADLAASRRFWEQVAPALGLTIYRSEPERFHVGARDRSFAVVQDGRPVTANLELGIPVADAAAVVKFARIASEAGYRPGAGPGSVVDPDGNQVVASNR
jgi:catechol 2,3-dioxygenase-like lactoylglutathione lyase family enzyme